VVVPLAIPTGQEDVAHPDLSYRHRVLKTYYSTKMKMKEYDQQHVMHRHEDVVYRDASKMKE
jgi:hypothetical protein